MNRPLISFVLFCYKQEAFIEEAARAALAQTYSPLEIVISDDCSPDRSFEVIQRVVADYRGPHKVILSRNEHNLGIGPHVSKIMTQLVHGEVIVMAAGDDVSVPERTETVFQAWDRTGRKAACILNGYERITIDGVPVDLARPSQSVCFWHETIVAHCKKNCPMIMPGCTQTCSAEVFRRFGPIPLAPHIEDDTISLRAMSFGGVLLVPDVLTHWRMAGSVSRVKAPEVMWEQDRLYRYEVAEQLLADSALMVNLSAWNRFGIRYVARANKLLAAQSSGLVRILGLVLLALICNPKTTFHNFKLLHRRLGSIRWRRLLCLSRETRIAL